jgi:hypothetical protein
VLLVRGIGEAPQKTAAEEVLQAAAGTKRPEFWLHSGYKKRQPEAPVADAKSGQP